MLRVTALAALAVLALGGLADGDADHDNEVFWSAFSADRICVLRANEWASEMATNETISSLINLENDAGFANDLANAALQRLRTAEAQAALRAAVAEARVAGGEDSVVAHGVRTEVLKALLEEKRAQEATLAPLVGSRLVSLPNIGFIGRGYNLLEGNPRDQEYGADRGYRMPVVELAYSVPGRLAADARHILPDNVDAIEAQASHFTSVATYISTELEFKQQLDTAIQVDTSVGIGKGNLFSVRYSYSASYQRSVEGMKSSDSAYVEIEATSTAYNASLLPGVRHTPTADFRAWLCSLPTSYGEANKLPFAQFVERYGTHVIRQAAFGGVGIQRYSMTASEAEAFWSQKMEEGHSQSSGASYKGAGTGQSVDASIALGKEVEAAMSSLGVARSEWYIGGSPAVGSFDEGSTDAAKEWARTVDDNPVPIWIQLAYLPDFVASLQIDECADGRLANRTAALDAYFEGIDGPSSDDCATNNTDVLRFGDLVTLHRQASPTSDVFEFLAGSPRNPPFPKTPNQAQIVPPPTISMSTIGYHLSSRQWGTQCTSMVTLFCNGNKKASYLVACGAKYYILGPFHHVVKELDPRTFIEWPLDDPYWRSDDRSDIILVYDEYSGSTVTDRKFLAVFRETSSAREVWQAKLTIAYDAFLDACLPQVNGSVTAVGGPALKDRSNTFWADLVPAFTTITVDDNNNFMYFVQDEYYWYERFQGTLTPGDGGPNGNPTSTNKFLHRLASQYHKDYVSDNTGRYYLRIRMIAFHPSYTADMSLIPDTKGNRQIIYSADYSNELLIAPNYAASSAAANVSRYTMTDWLALSSNYVSSFLLSHVSGTVTRPWGQDDLQFTFRLQSSTIIYNQVHRPIYYGDQVMLVSHKDGVMYDCDRVPSIPSKACFRDVQPLRDASEPAVPYSSFRILHRDPTAAGTKCLPVVNKEDVLLQVTSSGADADKQQFGKSPARLLLERNEPKTSYGREVTRQLQDVIVDSDESEDLESRGTLKVTRIDQRDLAPIVRLATPSILASKVEVIQDAGLAWAVSLAEIYIWDEFGKDITFLADEITQWTEQPPTGTVKDPYLAVDRKLDTFAYASIMSSYGSDPYIQLHFPYNVNISRITLHSQQDSNQKAIKNARLNLYGPTQKSWLLNGDLQQDVWVSNQHTYVSYIKISFLPETAEHGHYNVGLKEVTVIAPDGSDISTLGIASQSSTHIYNGIGYWAFKAIDGNLETDAVSQDQTGQMRNISAWWMLSYPTPMAVQKISITNRATFTYRLQSAVLEAFDATNTVVASKTLTDTDITCIRIPQTFNLIVGGQFTSPEARAAAWNGTDWTALGDVVIAGIGVFTFAQFDGLTIVGGEFSAYSGGSLSNVAAWTSEAGLWTPLGSGINGRVRTLVVWGGALIAGGDFSVAGASAAANVAQWNGVAWAQLGGGTSGPVYCSVLYDGAPVLGGDFGSAGDVGTNRIARWTGTSWRALGTGMDDIVISMVVYGAVGLVATGYFTTAGGVTVNRIALWNGSAWTAMQGGLDAAGFALAVYKGKLVVGGSFGLAGSTTAASIARWDGLSWTALSTGTNDDVRTLGVHNDVLLAGGAFSQAGDQMVNYLAQWDGTVWAKPAKSTFNNTVNVIFTYEAHDC